MNGRQQLPNLKRERNDHVDLDRAVFKVHASTSLNFNCIHSTRRGTYIKNLTYKTCVYTYS